MNIAIWVLAGAALGWMGVACWDFNEEQGPTVSTIIGAVGGLFGEKLVAPMSLAAAAVPANFSTEEFLFAATVAATFLFVGSMVSNGGGCSYSRDRQRKAEAPEGG